MARERRKIVTLGICLLGLILAFRFWFLAAPSPPAPVPKAEAKIEFQSYDLPHSLVRVVTVPVGGRWEVRAGLSEGVEPVETLATKAKAIAAINAGFFDPSNQKSTSYVFRDRKIVADPEKNERLTRNPQLKPYLPQIFNRTEWRRYQCGETERYEFARHLEPPPEGCELVDAMGAGPRLLPEMTAKLEAFLTPERDPIGIEQRNARSAIAIKADGGLILAIASQKPGNAPSGLSLPEFAEFLRDLGAISALNLDGGSSSALFYRGETFYGTESTVQRPIKSFIYAIDSKNPVSPRNSMS